MPPSSVLGVVALVGTYAQEPSTEITVEPHTFVSEPGVSLELFRYLPADRKHSTIVLMTHGFGVDYREFDLKAPIQLARFLAARGFEVWCTNFRGTGHGTPTSLTDLRRWRFSFDDMVHTDLAATIPYVLAKSGASRFLWLGHSLGGAAIEAYLSTHPDAPCAGAVMVAPAVCVKYPGWRRDPKRRKLLAWATSFRRMLPPSLPYPQGPGARLLDSLVLGPLGANALNRSFGYLVWAPENTDADLTHYALGNLVTGTNTTVLMQLMQWEGFLDTFTYGSSPHERLCESSAYRKRAGFQSYTSLLPQFKVPQLWLTGPVDYLVPNGMAARAFALSGAADKTLLDASRVNGFAVDYGHGDLIVGLRAPKEIYPRIADWLAEHAK